MIKTEKETFWKRGTHTLPVVTLSLSVMKLTNNSEPEMLIFTANQVKKHLPRYINFMKFKATS